MKILTQLRFFYTGIACLMFVLCAIAQKSNVSLSILLQKDEKENTVYELFLSEEKLQKQKLIVLQNYLINQKDKNSKEYKLSVDEFEKCRLTYNLWLVSKSKQDSSLFASSIYRFNYIPQILWFGTQYEREQSMLIHYFDWIDLKNPNIVKTSKIKDWMDNYVNLNMKLVTSKSMLDTIISKAARTAIEKSKQGSPIVYGWMVDYFYKGFETNNIPNGMKVLEPYLNDPKCLTSKRMEIERRLNGMKTLLKGTIAPNILLNEATGNSFDLNTFHPATKYILLLFWSADCSHCVETVSSLYPWQQFAKQQQEISVVAVSLDETDTEVKIWNKKINELPNWKHIRAIEGLRSKVASDYFVLATPVMILLDSKTKEIILLPTSFNELQGFYE